MEVAVRAEGLRKTYGKVEALRGVDLVVPAGTVCGLLGPNGAGKTTVVRILSTLARATAGTAQVAGYDVARAPDEVRQRIGLAGQYAAVDELLTCRANLVMFGRLYHLPAARARQRAEELLTRFALTEAGDRLVRTYSGGMRRRLDLAASLIVAPPVLFLDEPTTGLDPRTRLAMWDTLTELVNGGTTLLLTTQYLDEADRLADQIVVLNTGLVAAAGSPAELKASVGGERLDVVVREAVDLPWAVDALRTVTGSAPDVSAEDRRVTASAPSGTAALVAAARALDETGVKVEDITLRHPTLDEVFLHLTATEAA
jgi:ABC-2 type transport system ATP-binding protein